MNPSTSLVDLIVTRNLDLHPLISHRRSICSLPARETKVGIPTRRRCFAYAIFEQQRTLAEILEGFSLICQDIESQLSPLQRH